MAGYLVNSSGNGGVIAIDRVSDALNLDLQFRSLLLNNQ